MIFGTKGDFAIEIDSIEKIDKHLLGSINFWIRNEDIGDRDTTVILDIPARELFALLSHQ